MDQSGKRQGLLLCVSLLLFQTIPSQCTLVPASFSCSSTAPVGRSVLSATSNSIKVDLTHTMCGQIEVSGAASGFHSRPGGFDPNSASTQYARAIRIPQGTYDFGIADRPAVYNSNTRRWVYKSGISSFFPTAMSYETTTKAIVDMYSYCRPPRGKYLCVRRFRVNNRSIRYMDVKIIIFWDTTAGIVVRTAYPAVTGTCNRATSLFYRCNWNG